MYARSVNLSNSIRQNLVSLLRIKDPSILDENILVNGIDCKVLRANQGWKKGKIEININIQFHPEE